MTTPHYKFFDTVKKELPENQGDYFINHFGEVLSFETIFMAHTDQYGTSDGCTKLKEFDKRENIIAVPFIGIFDNHKQPIYFEDIVKYHGYVGVIRKHEKYNFYRFESPEMIEAEWDIYSADPEGLLVVGSSLTNPKLLTC